MDFLLHFSNSNRKQMSSSRQVLSVLGLISSSTLLPQPPGQPLQFVPTKQLESVRHPKIATATAMAHENCPKPSKLRHTSGFAHPFLKAGH
jgi:hypothetical protein